MTRKEERQKAANEYCESEVVPAENLQMAYGDFLNGAKWADKTMIEKACSILEDMTEGRLGKRFINEFKNKLTYGVLERH